MATERKATLQENVFTPKGEKLMHVLQIQVAEENEDYCLCITVTRDEEVQITFLKIINNGLREKYMMQEVWFLEDLTLVDGRDATTDNPHLDLHFQTVCSWEASSTAAKYAFVRSLRKMNKVYLQKDIQFLNFDTDYIQEMSFFGVPEDIMLDNPHLDLHFQTVCSWEASSTAAKYAFVRSLRKMNKVYLQKDIQFLNFDTDYIQEMSFFGVPEDTMLDNPHLDLHFQTVCSWEASSTAAKYAFVRSLRKMNKVYLQKDIQFLNFDTDYIQEMSFFGVPEDTMLDNPHLDLHFQTVCSWEASSTAAKYAFVRSLRKMNKVYLQKDIQFLNFDTDYIQEMSFFGVPEDTMLVKQLCLQAFNCICLLGSL